MLVKNYSNDDLKALIHKDKVHRNVHTDAAIFELEMQRIRGRSWIYIAHDNQVKNLGDYFATSIGTQIEAWLSYMTNQEEAR